MPLLYNENINHKVAPDFDATCNVRFNYALHDKANDTLIALGTTSAHYRIRALATTWSSTKLDEFSFFNAQKYTII
jgi:hypothetical protein